MEGGGEEHRLCFRDEICQKPILALVLKSWCSVPDMALMSVNLKIEQMILRNATFCTKFYMSRSFRQIYSIGDFL